MKIDKNGSAPLHSQIHDLLRNSIVSRRLASDQAVPSERELSEELKVSRMTVRQAMNSLRKEGLIYKKRGKGTFVSPLKLDIHTRDLKGFSDEMLRRGMKPTSRVLGMERVIADGEAAKRLKLAEGAEVFSLKRLRLVDEIPMAVETVCLPTDLFPGLNKHNFAKRSLYQTLETKYGVRFFSAAEDVEATISDASVSELLKVANRSPLLIVYRTVFTEDNRPVEYTKSIYRADRYRASFFLTKK
jgi:GntR family transcriptional regulator